VSLPPYQISLDGFAPDHFRVRSFLGKEAVSEAYSFDLVVDCDSEGDAVERVILGQRATLVFNVGDAPRSFHGIVASARLDEVHFASQSIKYRLRVVPRLWLLKRTQRTRIFQRMRVPEIVASVLLDAGISARFQLTRAYPQREYTTQYEETDYRFIKRILAEAGIYFYFPQGSTPDGDALSASSMASFSSAAIGIGEVLIPGDTVICADDAACYPPLRGDNAATLAASTAAALAPAVGAAVGVGQGGRGRRDGERRCGSRDRHRRGRGSLFRRADTALPPERGRGASDARSRHALHAPQHGAIQRGGLPRLRS